MKGVCSPTPTSSSPPTTDGMQASTAYRRKSGALTRRTSACRSWCAAPAWRRTSGGRKYVEYANGKRELYHLDRDPYELRDSYDPSDPPATLVARLKKLKS